jgi:hypothetical protein
MHVNPACLGVETVPLDFISGAYMSTEYGVCNRVANLFLAKHRDSGVCVLLWHKQVDRHVHHLKQRPLGKPRGRKHNVDTCPSLPIDGSLNFLATLTHHVRQPPRFFVERPPAICGSLLLLACRLIGLQLGSLQLA